MSWRELLVTWSWASLARIAFSSVGVIAGEEEVVVVETMVAGVLLGTMFDRGGFVVDVVVLIDCVVLVVVACGRPEEGLCAEAVGRSADSLRGPGFDAVCLFEEFLFLLPLILDACLRSSKIAQCKR